MFYFLSNLLKTFSKSHNHDWSLQTDTGGTTATSSSAGLNKSFVLRFKNLHLHAFFQGNKLFVLLHSLDHLCWSGLPILSVNWGLYDMVRWYVLEPRQPSKRCCFHWYSKKREKIKNYSQKNFQKDPTPQGWTSHITSVQSHNFVNLLKGFL